MLTPLTVCSDFNFRVYGYWILDLFNCLLLYSIFIMSNLTKLEFVAFNITGKNYISWTIDAKIQVEAIRLRDTIKNQNQESKQTTSDNVFHSSPST